jgi:hypothetical protein
MAIKIAAFNVKILFIAEHKVCPELTDLIFVINVGFKDSYTSKSGDLKFS